jgi:hypothetical protein
MMLSVESAAKVRMIFKYANIHRHFSLNNCIFAVQSDSKEQPQERKVESKFLKMKYIDKQSNPDDISPEF